MKLQLLLIAVCVCAASAGIPKKLFKKYAMKKVMESCLGEQLLGAIRQEVKVACDKCHGEEGPELPMIGNLLQAMFAGSELGPRPAQQGSQDVQYVVVPIQFQSAPAQESLPQEPAQQSPPQVPVQQIVPQAPAQQSAPQEPAQQSPPQVPVQQIVPQAPAQQSAPQAPAQDRSKRAAYYGKSPAEILKLREKISSIVGNVTCVMQEMKMLNADNEVDYDSIKGRIASLPLPKELVDDMHQGVEHCRQFASCLPDSIFEKTPITAGFGKQIAFFKCMKMAKLEACMKQDFREDYLPALMEDGLGMDGEESFETIITSALLEEADGMM